MADEEIGEVGTGEIGRAESKGWYGSPGGTGKPGKTTRADGSRVRRRIDPSVVEAAMRGIADRTGEIGTKWPKGMPRLHRSYPVWVIEGFECNGNPAAEPGAPYCTRQGVHGPHHVKGLAEDLMDWLREDASHFLMVDWLVSRGIPDSSMRTICDRNACFAEVFEMAKLVQRSRIEHGVLEGVLTERLGILMLVNFHGYTDGSKDVNLSVSGSPRLPPTVEETKEMILQLKEHQADLERVLTMATALGREELFVTS